MIEITNKTIDMKRYIVGNGEGMFEDKKGQYVTLKEAKQYANQRVIEELEELLNGDELHGNCISLWDIKNRIAELKQ